MFLSAFHELYQNSMDANSAAGSMVPSDSSLIAGTSLGSDCGNDSTYETSELGTPRDREVICTDIGMDRDKEDQELTNPTRSTGKEPFSTNGVLSPSKDFLQGFQEKGYSDNKLQRRKERSINQQTIDNNTLQVKSRSSAETVDSPQIEGVKIDNHAKKLSEDSLESCMSSARHEHPGSVEALKHDHLSAISDLELPHNLPIVLPTDEQQKMNRVLTIVQQRLATARTDIEDLIARLNQELAVRQYLSTKVCSKY